MTSSRFLHPLYRPLQRLPRRTLHLVVLAGCLLAAMPAPGSASASAGTAPNAGVSGGALVARGPFGDDVWIDSVSVSRGPDRDRDGFASGLQVSFDADTDGPDIEAYARLSLSGSGGVERLLYDTAPFWLHQRSSQDRIDVELDLLDRFAADRYDLLIELRQVRRDALLDVVDRRVFANLGGIALEDARRDGRIADDPFRIGYQTGYSSGGQASSSYVAVDYAGAGGPWGLAALIALALWRRCRRRSPFATGAGRAGSAASGRVMPPDSSVVDDLADGRRTTLYS